MRLLYIHQHFATPQGSVGIRSYQMARGMIQRGHAVTMVCGRGIDGQSGLSGSFAHGIRRGVVDGIDVIEVDLSYSNADGFLKRVGTFLSFMWRTVRLVFTERYDVLFASTTPLTVGLPGIIGRWIRRKPFVFEVRDLWPELPRAMGVIRNPLILWAMSALEWASYRSAHRLIGLSPGIVDGIARRGVPRRRIALIPNGCDLDIFSAPGAPWQPEGVRDESLLAIFAGAHGLANGLDSVIDAAEILQRRERNDIQFVLIGNGMLKPALKARAEREKMSNVIFLDAVKKTELVGLLRRADVGLQILANIPAFYYGTSPNKFFDYIAIGLPVLNNYPGWLAEMITEADCGIAVPPDDAEAFADALCAFADDRERTAEQGRNARALAENRFARRALVDAWADWVEGVIDSKRGPGTEIEIR
ncbi:glycosyltransferase family 4 protein [Sphingomonas panacisoli]|uniref:Glycosyltransferase family 4 protein n=1 Tax=Sphingomonas panacisoli TaxID=1813879 RepID=A0A5B8LFD4_9SPHN|nr:glycosyltransferase family 4 protein [Sphingomonas panacisoli]QDZ06948.1 glycosyltransferase family 4 protein [Sphingomonas panacisoli]